MPHSPRSILSWTGQTECGTQLKDLDIQSSIAMGASGGKPTIQGSDTKCEIGDFVLGCDGISGAVINVVKEIFKDKIINTIEDMMTSALKSVISRGNDELSQLNMEVPLTNDYALIRFDLTQPPAVISDYSITGKFTCSLTRAEENIMLSFRLFFTVLTLLCVTQVKFFWTWCRRAIPVRRPHFKSRPFQGTLPRRVGFCRWPSPHTLSIQLSTRTMWAAVWSRSSPTIT